jgi:hypothetical protein
MKIDKERKKDGWMIHKQGRKLEWAGEGRIEI